MSDKDSCFLVGSGYEAKVYQPQTGFVATGPLCVRVSVSFCMGERAPISSLEDQILG